MTPLERASHISVVATSLVLCAALVFLFTSAGQPSSKPEQSTVGKQLHLRDIDWKQSSSTIILALSTRCPFCAQSGPFYERLSHELQNNTNTKLLAVFAEDDLAARKFLELTRLKIRYIPSILLSDLGVQATPTILKVDSRGVVTNEWQGKLSYLEERKVIHLGADLSFWRALNLR